MVQKLMRIIFDTAGTAVIEYALLATLVALALIPASIQMGVSLDGLFNKVAVTITPPAP